MSMMERMRTALGMRLLTGSKAVSEVRFAPTWLKHAWSDVAFRLLAKEGYKANAAVYACIQAWAQAFPEPELGVRMLDGDGDGEWLRDHPARALIARPNEAMGEDEFWAFVVTYMALGGNAYIWIERDRGGRPRALWPLHDGQMAPIPGASPGDGWIKHYTYDDGSGGNPVIVPPEDVIHLRWAIDPLQPTRGLSPLVAASRAVDTANEALRYQYALLKNDAVVSTLVGIKEPVGPARLAQLKQQFRDSFGGDNRGEVAFAEGSDMTIQRLGANLQELAIEALLNVPEANIAAAFEVPPGLAGLNVALQRPTGLGSTGDTAVQEFTQRRLVPRWRRVASQFTVGLLRQFDDDPRLSMEFDTSRVQALREDDAALIGALNTATVAGWMLVAEARSRAGLEDLGPSTNVFLRSFSVVEVPVGGQPAPVVTDVQPAALPAPTDGADDAEDADVIDAPEAAGAKAAMRPFPQASAKASPPTRAEIDAMIAGLARRQRLSEAATRAIARELAALRDAVAATGEVTDAQMAPLRRALRAMGETAASEAFVTVGDLIGQAVAFSPEAPGVRAILDAVGERIKGTEDVTRQRVAGYVAQATRDGMSIGQLGRLIREDASGAFSRSRAETIARTETGTVYNSASAAGYRASGRVAMVRVFDGDEDEPCKSANGALWTLDRAEAEPLGHPNCFPGGTMVLAPNRTASFARWFEGEVVIFGTSANDLVSCTPNHPILTRRGWIVAGDLREGDHVFRCLDAQGVARLVDPDNDQVPSRIEDVARAFVESGECATPAVPPAAVALDRYGSGRDVNVVWADGLGEGGRSAESVQHRAERAIVLSDVRLAALLTGRTGAEVFEGAPGTPNGIMSGGRASLAPGRTDGSHLTSPGLGSATDAVSVSGKCLAQTCAVGAGRVGDVVQSLARHVSCVDAGEVEGESVPARGAPNDASPVQQSVNGGLADAEAQGQLLTALSALVSETQVVRVDRGQFAGHVYNLETQQGWYIANNIISHNCTRSFAPVVDLEV